MIVVARPASASTAFGVTVENATGRPIDALLPGDRITLAIRMSGGVQVFALRASAWGYDEAVVDFVSGDAVSSINHLTAVPGVGVFSGLGNSLVASFPPGTIGTGRLAESSIASHGNRVGFFRGLGLFTSNSNPDDPGLDFAIGGGGAQARITFRMVAPGSAVIHVGTGYPDDGEFVSGGDRDQSANTSIRIHVIPEPGTGLLMLLGLAVLSRRPQSDRRSPIADDQVDRSKPER